MTSPRLTEVALFTAEVDCLTSFYERVLGVEPADDHFAFSLEGLDAHAASLAAAGLGVDGPRNLAWGRSAYLRDPDGRLVELT